MDEDEEPLISKSMWKNIILASVILFVLIGAGFVMSSYNLLVSTDMGVLQKQANIQSNLQMRADLVPNLVATIIGSGRFESGTLNEIISLRTQSNQIRMGVASSTTAEGLQEQDSNLNNVIGRLLMISEQYPTLKTTDSYKELMGQLKDTELQIRNSRNEYNAAVYDYQTVTRSTPTNIFAGWFGFNSNRYTMFSASSQSQSVPVVNF